MTKVLMVLTSHGELGSTGRRTGFYLPEAAHPWAVFRRAGYDIDYVSPKGGEAPADGVDRSDPVQSAFLDDAAARAGIRETLTPQQVDPAEYDAIFYVGGHGTMWDLPDNEALAATATAIYESGGIVGAVCHGPAGLVNVSLSDGSYLVDGRQVAAFTNAEEAAVALDSVVPFLLQSRLEERGAKHSAAANFEPHVVADGRLVTGQNPASAAGVAERIVELLSER
jgi:putative intracellular protease/amidase